MKTKAVAVLLLVIGIAANAHAFYRFSGRLSTRREFWTRKTLNFPTPFEDQYQDGDM